MQTVNANEELLPTYPEIGRNGRAGVTYEKVPAKKNYSMMNLPRYQRN